MDIVEFIAFATISNWCKSFRCWLSSPILIYLVWETELTKLTMASLFHLDVVLISVHAKWKLWKFLFISQIEFRPSKKIIAMQPDLLLYPAIPQQWTIEQQSVKHCVSSSCAFLRSVSAEMYSHTGCTLGVFFFIYSTKQPLTVKHWVIQMNRERQPYWGRPVSGLNPDPLPVKWVEPTGLRMHGRGISDPRPKISFLRFLKYPSLPFNGIPEYPTLPPASWPLPTGNQRVFIIRY